LRDPRRRLRGDLVREAVRAAHDDPEWRALLRRTLLDEGIVIDVTPMRSVSVSGGVARLGAGARLGDVYDSLEEHGLTIPAGCGPTVGISGLTLGGGLGILGRKHGLTSDHLLGAQIVLADGRVVECDERRDEELFWALRGAGGGNFGVVSSLLFETIPAPAATSFHLIWSDTQAPAAIDAWQAWVPSRPTSSRPVCF
jgi:FAD/FMN-containing dehydrogenase